MNELAEMSMSMVVVAKACDEIGWDDFVHGRLLPITFHLIARGQVYRWRLSILQQRSLI